jgi:surface antigen
MHKVLRRRYVRVGLLVCNVLLLATVATVVWRGGGDATPKNLHAGLPVDAPNTQGAADPLDQLSSADIAVNLARMTSLPEAIAVTNQADSVSAEMAITPVDNTVVSKPQQVATGLKSRHDIQAYVAQPGDTIASIAAKFNVTSDSIMGSNGLSANAVSPGVTLTIPPVNGLVYTVQTGDTPDSLAAKFNASKDQIIAYNDAELSGLQVGQQIIIPNGRQPVPTYNARASSSSYSYGFAFGSSPIYGSNGYDWGFCTWYVATQVSVPSNWGNANTWDNLAPLSGWTVSSVPRMGAIGQTDRGSEGHVAVVDGVSPDGTMIQYRDMNGIAGFARVGQSDWVPASHFEHYIYR